VAPYVESSNVGASGRRNARLCRMQLRTIQFSDVHFWFTYPMLLYIIYVSRLD